MNAKCASCQNFWGSSEELEWDGYSIICKYCPEREIMPNIKITAEVDGKQVPLENISTETFEAIKALNPIPAVRIGNFPGAPEDRRLFLGISAKFKRSIAKCNVGGMVVININNGEIGKVREKIQRIPHFEDGEPYENIKFL